MQSLRERVNPTAHARKQLYSKPAGALLLNHITTQHDLTPLSTDLPRQDEVLHVARWLQKRRFCICKGFISFEHNLNKWFALHHSLLHSITLKLKCCRRSIVQKHQSFAILLYVMRFAFVPFFFFLAHHGFLNFTPKLRRVEVILRKKSKWLSF